MNFPAKPSILFVWAIILTLVLASILPCGVRAQTAETATNTEKEKQAAELQKKTLVLLNDLAAASWSLKLPQNRLLIMSGAADLLWPIDEKRARTVYWDALNALNSISSSVRSTGPPLSKEERMKAIQNYLSTFELRQKLLRQVARRDAQLALEMLRASRQVPPRQLGTEFTFPDDAQLEQGIASELAARDPAQAFQLARQSLAKGLTVEVLNLLQRLNYIDSEKGSQFAGELVAKLRTTNVANDNQASIIAVQLLQESRTPDSNRRASLAPVNGDYRGSLKPLSLSDEQKRDLVEVLTDAALSATVAPHVLWQVMIVMPEVEKFFPERRAALEKKLTGLNLRRSQPDQGEVVINRPDTPEEIVRLARAAGNATPSASYYEAAILSVAQGKTDWFRDVLNKDIVNSDERAKLIDFLDSEEISTVVYRKQADQLENLLPKIRRKEERARAMIELALMLKAKSRDEDAAALLDEAETLIKTDLTDEKQTNALLTLLCAYAVIDPPKAFALAERTVDKANAQITLLLLLDKVVKSGAVKKNEIVLEQPGVMPLDFFLFKYGKGVTALAKADFGRTRALTERFERNELRLVAQLMVLRGLLQPPSPSLTAAN
ncbi:MAG TPA: hypothetical protein VHQ94_23480 [Pyrinomonadaceae bacterium]|nr:hypothetical protein [Pyrinomonadaceae bacterium]